MKVLFLTPWYPDEHSPDHGVFVRDQALTILRDHEVWIVSGKIDYGTFGLSSLSRRDSTYKGLKEFRLRVKKSLPVFNQLNFFLRISLETLRIARSFKPDLIHSNIGYPGAFWGWTMSTLLKIPYVVTEHTRITNNFRSAVHKQLTLFGFRKARQIIAVSRWHADEIFRFVAIKPVVIHNVINFEKFPPIAPLRDTREFQIGFLGHVDTPVKGLDILLQAIAQLPDSFVLHIGGRGSLMDGYMRLAEELNVVHKCKFHGAIPSDQVPSFMSKLHFFISSSRSETFGIAMVEALTCGLPVVATDSGGPSEFINSENGLIVPVENADKLRDGISQMMRNYQRYNPAFIRKQVMHAFSSESFLEKISAVYGKAAGDS
jgi:glycosyltransferase involved in cell wall biosynthesis